MAKKPKNKGGRPRGEVGELALREGITRQAAWYRLRRATGRPKGRPRKKPVQ